MIYDYNEYGLWDNIMSLMLLCENRIVRKDLIKAFGNRADYSIKKLISLKLIKTRFNRQPHLLHLTPKGIEYISNNNRLPEEILRLNAKRKLNYSDSTMIRLSRKSQVLSDMVLNNYPISDKLMLENQPLFVPPVYLRENIEDGLDTKAGMTVKGIVTNKESFFGLYTMINGNQMLSPNTEAETTLRLDKILTEEYSNRTGTDITLNKSKIVFDNSLDGLEKIIKNQKGYEKKRRTDSMVRPTKHTFETVTWDKAYYVPTGEAGTKHLKSIIETPKETREKLEKNNNLSPSDIVFFPYDLSVLKFITKSRSEAKVYVPKEDKDKLEEIVNNPKVKMLPIEI